jgi:2-pyrone-4,6-dicarboxylate lactonase
MSTAAMFKEVLEPQEKAPTGSWDCLFHVYGNENRYPLKENRGYEPPLNATIEAAEKMHRTLGITHRVVVQSSADEESAGRMRLIDVLRGRDNCLGVAVIDPGISDLELTNLHDAGVRGARFNFVPWANTRIEPNDFHRLLNRIADYGWHVRIHTIADQWRQLIDLLALIKIPAVIDHMGHLQPNDGASVEAEKLLLQLLNQENWWVMIANCDRASSLLSGWDDVIPHARRLFAAAPDRAIWATDWPHVSYAKPELPNSAELLRFLNRMLPDIADRQKILVDNPARLFGV